MRARPLFAAALALAFAAPAAAQFGAAKFPPHTHTKGVIYGERDDLALTMDVYTPTQNPNGAGIVLCVSGMYKSGRQLLNFVEPRVVPKCLEKGYAVFAVMHGSQPKFTVPEIVDDVHRAVRFVKANAKTYGVDPNKLGIAGASSGGHLSLMMGCSPKPGVPGSRDLVERESSEVAAVACFFPVTDFVQFDRDELPDAQKPFRVLFDVRKPDPTTNKLERITDAERRELGRLNSPVYCAKKSAAPTYIIHGDADDLVPLHQSAMLHDLMTDCGAVCKLEVKKGMGHDIFNAVQYLPELLAWFDRHLLGQKK